MSWTQPAYEAVAQVLAERTGLTFPPGRRGGVEQGIRRAMARAKIADVDQYRAMLATDQTALDDLIVDVTVGETYFFREPAQFQFIRREVLPDIRRRRGSEHVVRAWSTACASGEEAYSLAIVFHEEGLTEQSHLLATDISPAALAKARLATYGEWSFRGEGEAIARPYFSRRGKSYVLDQRIGRHITFEPLNLALNAYPSVANGTWGMDLILCRNVLIYFNRETVRNVAGRLFDCLADGGWLITASTDPPLGEHTAFESVVTDVGVFYRRPVTSTGLRQEVAPLDSWPSPVAEMATGWQLDPPKRSSAVLPARRSHVAATSGQRKATTGHQKASKSKELRPKKAGGPPVRSDILLLAQEAFTQGNYQAVLEMTQGLAGDPAAAALHMRALANLDPSAADRAGAEATARHPFSTELQFLRAVLLVELEQDEAAEQAARRAIYLDGSLAIAHFTLGSILWRRGDLAGARRALRNARNLCLAKPADELVPLSDGEHAGRLAEAAAAQLAILESVQEATR